MHSTIGASNNGFGGECASPAESEPPFGMGQTTIRGTKEEYMATFQRSFLVAEYPGKKYDRALAEAIGLAEGALAVVRFQFAPGGDVLFGTCESEIKMKEYLNFHGGTVLWKR